MLNDAWIKKISNTELLQFIPLPGNWTGTNILTRSTCAGDQLDVPVEFPATFQKSATTVTYTHPDDFNVDVNVVGNTLGGHIIFGSYDISEDGGTTTVTSTDLIMPPDGQTISGTAPWTWTDGNIVCEGDADLSFSKI